VPSSSRTSPRTSATRETSASASAGEAARAALLRVLPKRLLSALVLRATRVRHAAWKDLQIRWFARRYGVDLGEAEHGTPAAYPDFNAFFTRALAAGARPVDPDPGAVVAPADGLVSEAGTVRDGRLPQAKGHTYTLEALLGGDPARSAGYEGGSFVTVYLAPPDYHRVHMPVGGRLVEMVHVPGTRYSVNPATTRAIAGLFARNERVVCTFEGDAGPFALALVGALCVGSMETVWAGAVTPRPRAAAPTAWRYDDGGRAPVHLARGEEMGRFNMGSTVIAVFPPGLVEWSRDLLPGARLRMGRAIGRLSSAASASRSRLQSNAEERR